MTHMGQEEQIRAALHSLFPEASGRPLSVHRLPSRRHFRVLTAMSAAAVVAAIAAGSVWAASRVGTNRPPHWPTSGTGPTATASTSPPTTGAPSWTSVCVHPDGDPAAQFVGITVAQGMQLAAQAGRTLVVYGAAGKCLTQGGVGYGRSVEVNIDQLGPGESIPRNARILTAQYGPA